MGINFTEALQLITAILPFQVGLSKTGVLILFIIAIAILISITARKHMKS